MKIAILLITAFWITQTPAQTQALDKLLQEVKKSQGVSGKINKQREQQFLSDKNNQQKLLASAKKQLADEEQISEALKAQLEDNEAILSELETELDDRSGILGELFGVAREAAGDLQADLDNSLVSAQFPNRNQALEQLANSKALPGIEQLENLWFTLQQEMTESGKVVRYQTEVLSSSGEPRQAEVIRIGPFNAISDGNYLRYLPETGQLAELVRQPDSQITSLAKQFSETQSGQADMAIDPTRGAILSLLIHTPDTVERINQGGVIGYIILLMGAAGFIYALVRLVMLTLTDKQMSGQVENIEAAEDNNPLGRVLLSAEKNTDQDMDTLQLVLDEAITREVPGLEKGLSMIKLLAAVAPLLGLLGTVTGMIATFQSISLFGTGDPKLMASGISQALVTTMLGLMVAIPLLFLHSLVASRSKRLIQILDEQTAGLISRRAEKNELD